MLNNEQIGISAEVSIADIFNIPISDTYRNRAVQEITDSIKPIIADIFRTNNIPLPIRHVAEKQSEIDFILTGNKTLSVKTNKRNLGKVAPQKIGQASSNTWFTILAERLGIVSPTTYIERAELFKLTALTQIEKLLGIYWEYMFDCDFLIHIFNVVDPNDVPTGAPKYIVISKNKIINPIWDPVKIKFTKEAVADWNESTTLKYDGVTIGEFQVHNNRDSFKFRFNMSGLLKLMEEGRLNFS